MLIYLKPGCKTFIYEGCVASLDIGSHNIDTGKPVNGCLAETNEVNCVCVCVSYNNVKKCWLPVLTDLLETGVNSPCFRF